MSDFIPAELKEWSLDQAVDKFFVQYERESIPTSEMYENVKYRNLSDIIVEQEEPPPAEEPGGDMDLGGLEGDLDLSLTPDTSTPADGGKPPVMQTPKINLQDFARNVARLTNNVQSLIDLKTVILNRAEKYIQNNYDEITAKELMSILERSYDLSPVNTTSSSQSDEKYPQPRTGVTGPAGA
jgi:hypothetical protein